MIKFYATLKKTAIDDEGQATVTLTVPASELPMINHLTQLTRKLLVCNIDLTPEEGGGRISYHEEREDDKSSDNSSELHDSRDEAVNGGKQLESWDS